MSALCDDVAPFIAKAVRFEEVQEQALTDDLTGLPNMRFVYMHVFRELARSERLKLETSVIAVDVDRLKAINDRFDLSCGDTLLREMASIARVSIGPYDICARWMSDKFLFVLSGTGADEAARKIVELRSSASRVRFTGTLKGVELSFSAGLAMFPYDGSTWPELLGVAADRLSHEKQLKRGEL